MKTRSALIFALSIIFAAAGVAAALPTVDELIKRADDFAEKSKQYFCRVEIEDVAGRATGRLRVRGDMYRLEIERLYPNGSVMGLETHIFDGKVIWISIRPGGGSVRSALKMDIARIEEIAAKTGEDVRIDRSDRGVHPFSALSALRRDYIIEVKEEIDDGRVALVMVEARLKPVEERKPAWTGAPFIRLLIERERGIPVHIARFNLEAERTFSMTLGTGNSQMPADPSMFAYTPPRQAEVQDIAAMLEEIARQLGTTDPTSR